MSKFSWKGFSNFQICFELLKFVTVFIFTMGVIARGFSLKIQLFSTSDLALVLMVLWKGLIKQKYVVSKTLAWIQLQLGPLKKSRPRVLARKNSAETPSITSTCSHIYVPEAVITNCRYIHRRRKDFFQAEANSGFFQG